MNICSRIQPLLGAFFDDELQDDLREEVAGHLDACADCRAELADIEQIEQIAREADVPIVTDGEWEQIWQNVQPALPTAPRARSWLHRPTALAAAALLLISIGLGYILHRPGSVQAGPAWEVMSLEAGSPDVSVAHYYDAAADVTVIWVVPASTQDGATSNGDTT